MKTVNPKRETLYRKQRTIKSPVSYSGIGIHTGRQVNLKFCPAPEGFGVCFKRVDLPGTPIVPATLEYVRDTKRSTTLGISDVKIHTVEHVLAAVSAFQLDNLCIEISNLEPPIGNGSSDVFVEMIENAGIQEQDQEIPIVKILQPVFWTEGDIHLVALPYEGFKISYTLSYPKSQILRSQFQSFDINAETFKKEIAVCRTFSEYSEISALIDHGLIKGGSLDNAVVIKDDVVLSKNGLFFPDEMVRHKILDLIGDLYLIGFQIQAHILSIRSGHASNFAFSQMILNYITREN